MSLLKIFKFNKINFKKLILILLVVIVFFSMVIFGVTSYKKSSNSSTFITVGNIDIPANLFLAEYNLIVQQNAYLLNQNPYMMSNILQGMISRYVSVLMFVNEANSLNIGASDEIVYKIISATPFFQDNGKFNKEVFQNTISKIYGSESNYIQTIKNDLKQTQLTGVFFNSFDIPNKVSDLFIDALNQTRNIDYVIFSRKNIKNIPTPTNNDLLTLRDSNKNLFTVPEFRSITLLEINTTDYLKNINVSDKEIQDYYERNKKNFLTEESRDISQILFDNAEEANAFYKNNKQNNSLHNKDKVNILQGVTAASLPAELVDTVFKAKVGIINPPVKTDVGYHIVVVNKINPSTPQPLNNVKSVIKSDILSNKISQLYENLKSQLSDSIANKKSLTEIKNNFNSRLLTVNKINQSGFDDNNNIISGPFQNSDLLKTAFDLPLKQVSEVIVINNKFYLLEVTNIFKEYIQSVTQAKNELIKLWNYNQSTNIINTQVTNFIESYNKSGKFNSQGVTVNNLTITRNKQTTNSPFNKNDLDQIFLSKINTPIEGTLDNGDIYVVVIKKINNRTVNKQKDSKENTQIKEYISNNFKEDMLTQIFIQLNSKYKVNINEKSLYNIINNK